MPLPLNSWEATRCRTPSSKPRHYLEEPSCPAPLKPQLVAKTFSMKCLNRKKQWLFQTGPNISRDSKGILLLSRFSWKMFLIQPPSPPNPTSMKCLLIDRRTPSSKPRHFIGAPSCPEPPKPQLVEKNLLYEMPKPQKQWFFQAGPNISRDSQGILLFSRLSWKNFPHSAPITPQSHFYEMPFL